MADEQAPAEVVRNEAETRFEARVGGGLAFLTYDENDGKLYLLHTEVPPEAEGHGIGSKLVKTALDHARGQGLKVAPFCPFAKAYVQRHKEYQDLLSGEA